MTKVGSTDAVAAVDCGTNSTRLLVVDGSGNVLDRQMRITRLGEAVDATGKIAPEAIARTVEVLRDYRTIIDAKDVRRVRVVATSATRDAGNSEEFFDAAERAIGSRPELLIGLEEGRLSFEGATARLPAHLQGEGVLLVADIGGGSTELIAGPADDGRVDDVTAVSLDIGCVRVSERFLQHDPPSDAEIRSARLFIGKLLRDAREQLSALPLDGVVIGLAGTVSTLASLDVGAPRYERDLVHHVLLGRDRVAFWLKVLAEERSAERLGHSGMVRGREDVIVGGVLVLDEIMDVFGCSACLVSEDDILDGLVMSLRSSAA